MYFEKIIGHHKIKTHFEKILNSGQIGNAYLFTGTEGSGKRLFAIELIKAINCVYKTTQVPCNDCLNCKRINEAWC